MTRPRFSTLVAGAVALVAALLAAAAVLLDYSGQPHGDKTIVTVRVWGDELAEAYRQSFAAFTRAHPEIEVHVNMVAYSTYFNTLRTDVAGGSADDIFWLSNAYLAAYADSGRLLNILTHLALTRPRTGSDPSSSSLPGTDSCGACRSSRTPVSPCTTTRTCSARPASTRPS